MALIATLAASVLSAVAELGRAVLAALAARMSPSLTSVTSEVTSSVGTRAVNGHSGSSKVPVFLVKSALKAGGLVGKELPINWIMPLVIVG